MIHSKLHRSEATKSLVEKNRKLPSELSPAHSDPATFFARDDFPSPLVLLLFSQQTLLCRGMCLHKLTSWVGMLSVLTLLLRSHFTRRASEWNSVFPFCARCFWGALREEFLFNFVVNCNSFWSVPTHFDAIHRQTYLSQEQALEKKRRRLCDWNMKRCWRKKAISVCEHLFWGKCISGISELTSHSFWVDFFSSDGMTRSMAWTFQRIFFQNKKSSSERFLMANFQRTSVRVK